MPSEALKNFGIRLEEVKQLLDAHEALTRVRRAEAALSKGGQSLTAIGEVVKHLVSKPGPGRPQEVQALNSAGVALLSAHLQGYISDLYREVAQKIVGKLVEDPALLATTNDLRGNPNEQNITRLFNSLGFPDILSGVTWKGMPNKSLRKKLATFNTLRNRIVHGKAEPVKKSQLKEFYEAFKNFADAIDNKISERVANVIGKAPW
jgi:hypothetical protein